MSAYREQQIKQKISDELQVTRGKLASYKMKVVGGVSTPSK